MTGSAFERLDAIVTRNAHAAIARNGFRLFLTGTVMLGTLSLVACSFAGAQKRPDAQRESGSITWQKLGVILRSFCMAYIALLASVALRSHFFDRYLLPLLAILLLVLARYYQQRVKANLPWACVLLIAAFGGFSAAATHDIFFLYRGYAQAIGEVRSGGTPANAILEPLEFGGWTEVEKVGYLNDPKIRVPEGAYVPQPPRAYPASCDEGLIKYMDWTPQSNLFTRSRSVQTGAAAR